MERTDITSDVPVSNDPGTDVSDNTSVNPPDTSSFDGSSIQSSNSDDIDSDDDGSIYVLTTRNEIIDKVTDEYVANLDMNDLPSPEEMASTLTHIMRDKITAHNKAVLKRKDKSATKFRVPEDLLFDQIAVLMAKIYPIARISCAGASADTAYDLLALYMDEGPDAGTYITSEEEFYNIAIRFNRRLSKKEFDEIMYRLRSLVPRKTRNMNKDLIAVNNGIFNYETKILEPFTPDTVFMTKSHVNYTPWASNVVIHNDEDGTDWDIESWMNTLSDDPEIVNLLWEILSAIIRPHVRWNKSAWFYSETGNNGKGTLCELMRSLCGETAFASIPLSDFGKDFALEPLTRSTAIIVDENDVGSFIDKAANLKAIITNDVIAINRKFKTPISYQFYGFMVQCLNEFPRIRDKSDSVYRRQLFIPFEKCFTGKERKYIKEDYLHRQEVLEYVLYKVLHDTNFYTLSEPQACKNVMDEYKEFNDPVRQFFEELQDSFSWDLLPFTFLYDLYRAWFRRNSPSGSIQGKTRFIQEIVNIANSGNKWYCIDKSKTLRVGDKMQGPEPLIAQYGVTEWQNPNFTGQDPNKLSTPQLNPFYRGLLRYTSQDATVIDEDPDEGTMEGGEQHADTD